MYAARALSCGAITGAGIGTCATARVTGAAVPGGVTMSAPSDEPLAGAAGAGGVKTAVDELLLNRPMISCPYTFECFGFGRVQYACVTPPAWRRPCPRACWPGRSGSC